jgi:hypothetical protein
MVTDCERSGGRAVGELGLGQEECRLGRGSAVVAN